MRAKSARPRINPILGISVKFIIIIIVIMIMIIIIIINLLLLLWRFSHH